MIRARIADALRVMARRIHPLETIRIEPEKFNPEQARALLRQEFGRAPAVKGDEQLLTGRDRINARRIENARAAIEARGLDYRVRSDGRHLQIASRWGWVDVWPTTDKWWISARKMKGIGLDALFKVLGVRG